MHNNLSAAPAIIVGEGSAQPGSTSPVEITVEWEGDDVVVVAQFDLVFDGDVLIPDVSNACSDVNWLCNQLAPGVIRWTTNVIFPGLPDTLIGTISFDVSSAPSGAYPLQIEEDLFFAANEDLVPANGSQNGLITIGSQQSSPDLGVSNVVPSSRNLEAGEAFSIEATVENIGNENSTTSTVRYLISENSTIEESDQLFASTDLPQLAGGETWINEESGTAPAISGAYWVGVCVESVAGESQLGNNCADGGQITVVNQGPSGFQINAGLNGNWWNGPERNGEGVQFEVADGGDGGLILVATIYSYDGMGNQVFLIAVGTVNGDTAEVDVFITQGGQWGDNYDPSLVNESQWGSGTFTASSCDAMHMTLTPNAAFLSMAYTDLSYDLVRLTTPAVSCPIDSPGTYLRSRDKSKN
jgi:hypothetical protein